MTSVAIMQPTYLPWIGYLSLMDRVDAFILLDTVQFARRSWQQRNRIKTANGPTWLTVPVLSKGKRDQLIADVEIDRTRDFPVSHIRSIEHAYRKAPFYDAYAPGLFEVLGQEQDRLSAVTGAVIEWLRTQFGITTPTRWASGMDNSGARAERLAMLCDQIGATEYVSPLGSKGYLDESDDFDLRGVPVTYHTYEHPRYPQLYGQFEPYMSAIDLLFNAGPDSLAIMRAGRT